MFNFIKYSKIYFAISALFLVPSLISLYLYGLKPAIDFTGGSLLEIRITPTLTDSVSDQSLTSLLEDSIEISSIQSSGPNTFIIRSKQITNEQNKAVEGQITQSLGIPEQIRFETVGPTLGGQLLKKTYYAIIIATIAILLYVAFQFRQLVYGVSAVLAMFHDTIIVLGIFSLLGHFYRIEVDTLFVTAVLTVLSFSVHDTIVVYDRIRESLRRHSDASFDAIVNKSIAETLTRSINNSMTIIFMLTALFLMGGDTIRWFVFALLIGTITGTYSSTFTAAPILVFLHRRFHKN